MSSSTTEIQTPTARHVVVSDELLTVELNDGRTLSVPLTWYPRLWYGTTEERIGWRLIGDGYGIHWADLDEDIRVGALLEGLPSRESQKSLKKWLDGHCSKTHGGTVAGDDTTTLGFQIRPRPLDCDDDEAIESSTLENLPPGAPEGS